MSSSYWAIRRFQSHAFNAATCSSITFCGVGCGFLGGRVCEAAAIERVQTKIESRRTATKNGGSLMIECLTRSVPVSCRPSLFLFDFRVRLNSQVLQSAGRPARS